MKQTISVFFSLRNNLVCVFNKSYALSESEMIEGGGPLVTGCLAIKCGNDKRIRNEKEKNPFL